jgi:hypothetical protein
VKSEVDVVRARSRIAMHGHLEKDSTKFDLLVAYAVAA